jgi:cobalamin transport system ATP-binding protein
VAVKKEKGVLFLMNAIEADKVFYRPNGKYILEDVSISVETGEFIGIGGPNGAGKSTLLKIMSNSLSPSYGHVRIFSKEINGYSQKELSKNLTVLPAEIPVPFDFSVSEIVLMGRSPYVKWWKDYSVEDENMVLKTLESLSLEKFADRKINSLSSGEKQKVFIAQAMCQEPKILLLDEPTSHLDMARQIEIFSLLRRISRERGISVVVVSHDMNLLSRYCKKILLLHKGKSVCYGTPNEVLSAKTIKDIYGVKALVSKDSKSQYPQIHIEDIH